MTRAPVQLADFIAGSAGGAFGVAVGFPLDTVKVRIQTQTERSGVWSCVRRTFRSEGLGGFYRGMSMPLSSVSVSSALLFGVYRSVLRRLQRMRGTSASDPPRGSHVFLSGFAGGVAQVLVVAPADMVKVRLQCRAGAESEAGPLRCCARVLREEGPLGLYRGSGALALRDGPAFATYFLVYHSLRRLLEGEGTRAWPAVLLAGGAAGACGWAVGTPMDVIKARLQADGVGERRYRGVAHCVRVSVRAEGPGVLFRGLAVNCLRAFPVSAAVFSVYELVMELLRHAC